MCCITQQRQPAKRPLFNRIAIGHWKLKHLLCFINQVFHLEATAPPGCPACGVVAGRVHSRRRQRLRDLPVAGPVELVWVKRRWFCDQARCSRGTFSEVTDQVPAFARSTARLCQALVTAVVVSGRAASEVARAHRVSWWLVTSMLTAAADVLLPDPDRVPVRRLGAKPFT